MEHRRLDALARALAALLDRRQALGAFLALAIAGLLSGDDALAKKKGGKKGKGGGKGGGKGNGKGKGKKKRKKRRGGGGSATRNCDEIALQPDAQGAGADLQNADLDLNDVLYAHYAVFCRTTMPNGQTDDSGCP